MHEAWARIHERGCGWYWVIPRLQAGDVYHVCSLVPAFRRQHGSAHPIFLVVQDGIQARMAAIYEDLFAEIIVEPELSRSVEDWRRFFEATGWPLFGPGAPMLVDPYLTLAVPPGVPPFCEDNGLPWIELYKLILRLPVESEPSPPPVNAVRAGEARRLCEAHGLQAGNSVLLFPYARSFHVDAQEHFACLARLLSSRGVDVLTSVAPGEAEIAGTRPIFIPFALLPDVAEYAGWAVAVRSGICDLLSSARCKKTFVYRQTGELQTWSVNSLGLARDAHEFAFPFWMDTPERFADLVLATEPPSAATLPPRALSDLVGSGPRRATVSALSFTEVQRQPDALAMSVAGARERLLDGPSALIVRDLPARDHPRWRELTDAFLGTLLDELGGRRRVSLHTCRDYKRADFFEESGASAVLAGRYRAACFWHTLIVVSSGALLPDLLPDEGIQRLVDLQPVPIGRRVYFHEVEALAARAASTIGAKPLAFAGFALVEGWFPAEAWGLWSAARRSSIKFAFAEPPRRSFTLSLGFMAAVSETFRSLRFAVSVNGALVGRREVNWPDGPWDVHMEVPASVVGEDREFLAHIHFAEIKSLLEQGVSGDPRLLAMGLHWVQVTLPEAG